MACKLLAWRAINCKGSVGHDQWYFVVASKHVYIRWCLCGRCGYVLFHVDYRTCGNLCDAACVLWLCAQCCWCKLPGWSGWVPSCEHGHWWLHCTIWRLAQETWLGRLFDLASCSSFWDHWKTRRFGFGAREYSAALYGSGGLYEDPWRISPELLSLNLTRLVASCSTAATQPLGAALQRIFSEGGYASMRLPLLAPGDTFPCFGSDTSEVCVKGKPSLVDNVPYSFLALQARPNSYSHSEVDFGTFTWSAWGVRLISEYGYGTIATAVGQWDFRRYEYIDNNPVGHNTVVIQEAFDGDSINFSQLHWATGQLSGVDIETDRVGWKCVELEGSVPYGSNRAEGWMEIMRRYACPLADGSFVLIDVLQVKKDRLALNLCLGFLGDCLGMFRTRTLGQSAIVTKTLSYVKTRGFHGAKHHLITSCCPFFPTARNVL